MYSVFSTARFLFRLQMSLGHSLFAVETKASGVPGGNPSVAESQFLE